MREMAKNITNHVTQKQISNMKCKKKKKKTT